MNKTLFSLDSIKLEKTKVFRDAIHNYISVENDVISNLIDSKEMQRLRRIKQLGGTHQVYLSAEHSRFSHSLGVYQISKMMCKSNCIGNFINDYDKLTVQCAALLHDVGHGPFSHCFEAVFSTNHEDYTIQIIEQDSEVHDILESFHEGFSYVVSSVIKKTHENRILISMVSSEIDADRMDYLLRDSYFTGTTYGQFDLQRILRIMKVVDGKIVFKESGVQSIEDYILARYHMYWQVYYHPTVRSYEQLLLSVFRRVKDLYKENHDLGDIAFLKPFLNGKVSSTQYTDLDESVVLYYFKQFQSNIDETLSDLATRFLNRNLFKYRDYIDNDDEMLTRSKFNEKGFLDNYYIVCDDQIQIPYRYIAEEDDKNQILIIKNDTLVSLPEVSEIVWALTNSKKSKKDHKLFYPNI